jgi:hypothetical protein
MAAGGLSVERLQEHLQQLSPAARALLVTRLEDAARRGERIPGGEALLHELRGVLRESREPGARRDHVARHFFQAVELFLIDDSAHKRQGRIARASLESLWRWICRDLVPQEAATYSAELGRALTAADSGASQHLTDVFQSLVAERIRSKLDSVQDDHKARRRLIGQIGTLDALDDVRDLRTVLSGRATFALIGTQLPARIRNLADAQLVDVKALLDSPLGGRGELLPQALILVMSRLAAPWQLIRLGVKAAASDDVSRIAKTPYGAAITITLAEIDRMVFELQTRLRRGAGPAANSLLYSIHDGIRGMRTELDFPPDSPCGQGLAAIRAQISEVLEAPIESAPARVRSLLRPPPTREIAPNAVLDAGEITETEALLEFLAICRNHASDLAISEMTVRTCNQVQQYLDTATPVLLEALRGAGAAERPFRQSQLDAAMRFSAKVFGKEYAVLLAKAAGVAANSERKAAARV